VGGLNAIFEGLDFSVIWALFGFGDGKIQYKWAVCGHIVLWKVGLIKMVYYKRCMYALDLVKLRL
jgi:hypothetical protein